MISFSIIYSVRLIGIARIQGSFMSSDSLGSLDIYPIFNEYLHIPVRIIYLYCHKNKYP